jgi:DNA mismatch endonuclease, patch repair protein
MPKYDPLSKEQRSERMSRVKSKNTKPEITARKLLSANGYRNYRLNVSRLAGKPDIVFSRQRKVIFIHGCFWHLHSCKSYRIPKTRQQFWNNKLNSNILRDKRIYWQLKKQGWKVLVLWECQLKRSKIDKTFVKIVNFLSSKGIAP